MSETGPATTPPQEPPATSTADVNKEMHIICKLHDDEKALMLQLLSNQAVIMKGISTLMRQRITDSMHSGYLEDLGQNLNVSSALQKKVLAGSKGIKPT